MKNRIKSFLGQDDIFSSLSVLPFSKYKKSYSQTDFLTASEISLYTNKALNKRAGKVGEIEFKLMKGENEIEEHDILTLLKKPNKTFTGQQFWEIYQKYRDIFGETYILLDSELVMGGGNKINEMYILRSDLVKPKFNKNTGVLVQIEYKTPEKTEIINGDRIIYGHRPRPASPLRGESLLCSGIRQIETGTQIDEYHSKILENGGRVEGVFNFDTNNLTKQQLTELKEQYQEEYGNASRAGLPLFLAGKAKYERLGLNPAELAYLETKKINFNDIVILTGVPSALLGLTSDETFANADASIRIFLKETINPELKSLTDTLNQHLVEDGLELSYIDPTPDNKEEKRKDLETADKTNSMTLNEKREVLGLDPVSYGDQIYAPFNIMPLGEERAEKPEEVKIKKIKHPLQNTDSRRLYHALCTKRLDRRQKLFLGVINEYFDDQLERLIEPLETVKHYRKKELLGEIFNSKLEIKLAKETVLPVLQELLNEAAEDAKEIAGSDWEYNETAEISSWLDKKTDIFSEQINETTFAKLKKEFAISAELGENRKDLIKRIEATYGGIKEARAETIARTEIHGVTQYGTHQGYIQAGMPIHIWVWAPGTKGGVRDSHQAMDGQEKPIGTAYSNGLMFPGDPSGSAGETINCQCFE
ncbi:MAG: phage portal protein [Candidatus Heimdallarchaeaceae archaeon]